MSTKIIIGNQYVVNNPPMGNLTTGDVLQAIEKDVYKVIECKDKILMCMKMQQGGELISYTYIKPSVARNILIPMVA